MKNYFFLITAVLLSFSSFAQTNFLDKPYIEIQTTVDTLITPDEIYISITLNESDSKNKISTEELEIKLFNLLKELNIDTQKDLRLINYNSKNHKYFLKNKQIVKTKQYELLVREAETAQLVLLATEDQGLTNVRISRFEHTQFKTIQSELKAKAALKAKQEAIIITKPLHQSVGKVLFISNGDSTKFITSLQSQIPGVNIRGAAGIYGNRNNNELIENTEFKKIQISTSISVNFEILPNS